MIILGIDPGPTESAWLYFESGKILRFAKETNPIVLLRIAEWSKGDAYRHHLAIEMIASFGMPVGREVFETVFWTGRFIQAWPGEWSRIYRKDVKLHLCGSMRAKDSNIRQALIDRYPASGGGKIPQVGTKKKRSPVWHSWRPLECSLNSRHVP